jgi:hypothetical protein
MSASESTYHADGPLAGRSFVCTICGYSSQDLADTQAHLRGIHEVEDTRELSQEEQGGLITRYSGEALVVDVPKWLTDHERPATVYSSAMHYHVKASLEEAARNLASLEPITWPDWVDFLVAELERQCPHDCDFRNILLRLRELIEKRAGIRRRNSGPSTHNGLPFQILK